MEDPVIYLVFESGLFLFFYHLLFHLYGETVGKGKQLSAETEHFCSSIVSLCRENCNIERNKSSWRTGGICCCVTLFFLLGVFNFQFFKGQWPSEMSFPKVHTESVCVNVSL